MKDIMPVLVSIYSSWQVQWLAALLVANLVLGIVASVRQQDFRLTAVADWLGSRLLPLFVGYGTAAFLAYANPEVHYLREIAWGTLVAAMFGYVLKNLRDFGIAAEDQPGGTASKPT